MEQVLAFTKGAQLRSLTLSDYRSLTIQPFIQDILNRFVASDNLALSIASAFKNNAKVANAFFEFDLDNAAESFSMKEPFLFPDQDPVLGLGFCNTQLAPFLENEGMERVQDPANWENIHRLLHRCGQATFTYEQICEEFDDATIALLDKLIKTWVVREQSMPERFKLPPAPGVFRLQHAALLYRTQTTGLLVDPHLHSNYGLDKLNRDITRAMLEGYVDGILISHSHYDHWHLPTLMMFPRDIPIIVPKVPQRSITCDDMQLRLRELGFENVIAVDWYAEPVLIGDMAVHVLPFYGEQPLVPGYDTPKHPTLRNWGNTYLVETEYYTSWFLIDGGTDPMGAMVDVAEVVRQRFGPIDQVLSNFQPLSYNSIGTDLSSWGLDIIGTLMSNPQIFSVINKEEGDYLSTLGPKGVAAICKIVDASACLPYAHSWTELGRYTQHDEPLIRETASELKHLGCATQVIPWRIGDGYLLTSNGMARCPAFYA